MVTVTGAPPWPVDCQLSPTFLLTVLEQDAGVGSGLDWVKQVWLPEMAQVPALSPAGLLPV
jgi:hypothetical protein